MYLTLDKDKFGVFQLSNEFVFRPEGHKFESRRRRRDNT